MVNRPRRFVTDDHLRRLDEIRASYDPDALFVSGWADPTWTGISRQYTAQEGGFLDVRSSVPVRSSATGCLAGHGVELVDVSEVRSRRQIPSVEGAYTVVEHPRGAARRAAVRSVEAACAAHHSGEDRGRLAGRGDRPGLSTPVDGWCTRSWMQPERPACSAVPALGANPAAAPEAARQPTRRFTVCAARTETGFPTAANIAFTARTRPVAEAVFRSLQTPRCHRRPIHGFRLRTSRPSSAAGPVVPPASRRLRSGGSPSARVRLTGSGRFRSSRRPAFTDDCDGCAADGLASGGWLVTPPHPGHSEQHGTHRGNSACCFHRETPVCDDRSRRTVPAVDIRHLKSRSGSVSILKVAAGQTISG